MSNNHAPVVFAWPGDLHLETADRENYRVAEWAVEQINTLVRPDFVQFAGDNAQHATAEQFELFTGLCSRLNMPHYALVGDHDAHHDPQANAYRAYCGDPYGAMSLRGFRFIRLNTMESRPLGISDEQIHWFRYQVDSAVSRGERIVVFQHHYPFQIWEDFSGPGIDAWREIVVTRPITAIFAGHTHYGQIANDGHNISIATRSIGDPEGGPPGFAVVYLHEDDLAVTYRSTEDSGPLVLVTHPRDVLLATRGKHIISGVDQCQVRTWSPVPVKSVIGRLNDAAPFEFVPAGPENWEAPLPGDRLPKGESVLAVEATDAEGNVGRSEMRVMTDRSGRYTAFPRVRPEVYQTKFC
jgi:predicted phosphodiesterase